MVIFIQKIGAFIYNLYNVMNWIIYQVLTGLD